MDTLILTLFILFVTHVIGGVAAFGSTLLALPLLLVFAGWELRPAVGMLLIVGSVQAVSMALLTGRGADRRVLWRILTVAGLGLPLGFLFADALPEAGLQALLGLILIGAGTTRLLDRLKEKEWTPPDWAMWTLLASSGVIHGAFGSGGATLTVYGRYALKAKETFRGTLSIVWVVLNVFVIAGLIAEGQINREVAIIALPGMLVVLGATFLGHRLAERCSQERFRDVVAIMLIVAGAITALRYFLR